MNESRSVFDPVLAVPPRPYVNTQFAEQLAFGPRIGDAACFTFTLHVARLEVCACVHVRASLRVCAYVCCCC